MSDLQEMLAVLSSACGCLSAGLSLARFGCDTSAPAVEIPTSRDYDPACGSESRPSRVIKKT